MILKLAETEKINASQKLCFRIGEEAKNEILDEYGINGDEDLVVERKIKKLENGVSISLTLVNEGREQVNLDEIIALDAEDIDENGILGDILSLQVFRLSRQKNDIPGMFSPVVQDDNMEDAAFSSAEIKAGGGIGWDDVGKAAELPVSFEADPAMLLINRNTGQVLLVGFSGQSRHLNSITLKSNKKRSAITGLTASAVYDGATINPGESCSTHELFLLYGHDCQLLLEQYAELLAGRHNIPRPDPAKKLSVFCTWYFYGTDFNEQDLDENLTCLKSKKIPFDVFQIDHCWMKTFGDFQVDPAIFPSGMENAAAKLRSAGYIPGIWTCPFVIEQHADVIKKYPDLILRDHNGDPCLFDCQVGRCYTLDPFAPNAEKYINELYKRLRSWGYDYHKLDFLRAVFVNEKARFYDRSKNRAQAYRKGLEMIRSALGEDAILVTCGGLFEGSIGLSDINRSGADVQGHWNYKGTRLASFPVRIKQILARNFYNRFWHCDPDAMQLRRRTAAFRGNTKDIHLAMGLFNDDEVFSAVVYQFINGGIACASEKLTDIDEDRLLLYRHVIPQYAPPASWINWDGYMPEELITSFDNPENDLEPYRVLTIANWSNEPVEKYINLSDIHGITGKATAVFEFKEQRFYGLYGPNERFSVELPPHSCRVFRLTNWCNEKVVILGTDLNLSMGPELRNVKSNFQCINGEINSPWMVPVNITVGLPLKNGKCDVRNISISPGDKHFKLQTELNSSACPLNL